MDVSFSLGTLGDSQLFRADRLGTSGSSRAPARGDGGTRPDDRARSEKFPPSRPRSGELPHVRVLHAIRV